MQLKFIQINIYKGKYFGELLDFLKREDADFISMQEVTGGSLNNYNPKGADLFVLLKQELGLFGVFNADFFVKNPEGYMGNALLTKHEIVDQKVVTLRETVTVEYEKSHDETFFPEIPRHLLDCICNLEDKIIHAFSFHGAWTAPPTDSAEALRQAKIIATYLKSLDGPFIGGCDFNNILGSKTVEILNEVANNLMLSSDVKQTTHPKIHKIVPRGYLIDYIYSSPHFKLKSLRVPQVTISDHLPVVAEVELVK